MLEARRVFIEMDKENRMEKFEEFLGRKILENYESWNLVNGSAIAVLPTRKGFLEKFLGFIN